MKRETIENLLKGLGVADDKLKEAVDTIMSENGKDIEQYKAEKTNLSAQLKAANDTLDKFKDVDVDGLKGEVERYKAAAEEAKTNGQKEVERLQFNYALDGALKNAGARSAKAVKAFIDENGLKLNGDVIIGLDEQISKIKQENGYLFNDDTTPIITTNTNTTNTGGADDKNAEVNSALRQLLGKE